MSHTMQLPSLLAEANSLPDGLTTMLVTRALCSLIDATIERLCGPMRHTRTRPSPPPDSTRAQSDVVASAVTPPEWASCTLCARARARARMCGHACVYARQTRGRKCEYAQKGVGVRPCACAYARAQRAPPHSARMCVRAVPARTSYSSLPVCGP